MRVIEVAGYPTVFEQSASGWSAYVPDLPVCVATGCTLDTCVMNMEGAIAFHIEGLLEDGLPIPQPRKLHDTQGWPHVRQGCA